MLRVDNWIGCGGAGFAVELTLGGIVLCFAWVVNLFINDIPWTVTWWLVCWFDLFRFEFGVIDFACGLF